MAENLRAAILAQDPTAQQREAIFTDDLEYVLRAAPGSGKTWTSCRRFIWRGANWPYPAGGLALLSFTNIAIQEFRAATVAVGQRGLLSDPNYVGTFDSFVERYILAPFGHLLTGASKRPRLFPGPRPGDWADRKLTLWMSARGKRRIRLPAWEVVPFPDGGRVGYKASDRFGGRPVEGGAECVRNLLSRGFYTHAQRVFWACKLIFDRPHIAKLLARRFPEVIVDEAQDCNAWLLVLLNHLRSEGAKITLVGDPDQCIFEFSMADATSLPSLKEKWAIPEKPLSRSFRCNDEIAAAVRNVGGNPAFVGSGAAASEVHRAFVVKEDPKGFARSVAALERLTGRAGIGLDAAAIVCRAHGQLESVRGQANFARLQGKTRDLATAAFLRDSRHDYRAAFQIVERLVRELTGDDPLWEHVDEAPGTAQAVTALMPIWKFVKDSRRLPPVNRSGDDWIASVREGLEQLIGELGVDCEVRLGQQIRKTGLTEQQVTLPLFQAKRQFPPVRQSTIHQVKGESIDAVLVIGSSKFWNSVVKAVQDGDNSEDRRLAYVAMTRARHLLLVALPHGHFSNQSETWKRWGFEVAP